MKKIETEKSVVQSIERAMVPVMNGPMDLFTPNTQEGVVLPDAERGYFDPDRNLDGIDLSLPRVQIVSGVQTFKFCDREENGGELQKKIVCLILASHQTRALFEEVQENGGKPKKSLLCFSLDGIQPSYRSREIMSESCAKCKAARSRDNGCNSRRRLYILCKENPDVPYNMDLNSASLRVYAAYMTQLKGKGIAAPLAVTEISLDKQKNPDGMIYSIANFSLLGVASSSQQRQQIRQVLDIYSDYFNPAKRENEKFRHEPIDAEYENGGGVDVPPFMAEMQ